MSRQDSLLKTGLDGAASSMGEMNPAIQAAWRAALPERFDFYHLGSVARLPEEPQPADPSANLAAENSFAVGFGFHGDMRGLLVLLIDKGLDLEVYSELGNLLAARVALELHRNGGLDVMISPPYSINPKRLGELLASPPGKMIRQAYTHRYGASEIRMEALILPSEGVAEVGHA